MKQQAFEERYAHEWDEFEGAVGPGAREAQGGP